MGAVELHHLRCVVAIADHGSFTAAAAALHLSQPALSYAVTNLERELGARLFDRTHTGAKLTAAGEAFVGPARRAVAEAESGRAAVDAVTGLVAGDLRVVGIRTAVAETAANVAWFHRQHPAVRLMVEDPVGDSDVIELLRSGRCDVGLMRAREVPEDLHSMAAATQVHVAVLPASWAPRTRTMSLADLEDIPLVLPIAGTRIRALIEGMFRAAGLTPTMACECSHIETGIELVRGGVGAVLSTELAASNLATEGLAVRPIRPRTEISLAVVTRQSPSPAAAAFCQMVHDHARPARRK
jgi:DNA-binding transcriptional LysR family regulator